MCEIHGRGHLSGIHRDQSFVLAEVLFQMQQGHKRRAQAEVVGLCGEAFHRHDHEQDLDPASIV